jgi:hypothetical protein
VAPYLSLVALCEYCEALAQSSVNLVSYFSDMRLLCIL